MTHAGHCAIAFCSLSRRGEFCSPSCVRSVLSSLLFLSFFAGVAPRMRAADERATHHTVPQASVDPRPIRLPIVDGTDIRFTRVFTADGLAQTKVSQIVQDSQGFIWFATQYGLNRYDGYNFKVFVHDPSNPTSLSGVAVQALFKDRDGALWIACDQFLNKFERATEAFTRYPVPSVSHISQDTTGLLWLSTPTGLYGLDPATGQFRQYSHDPNDPLSLSSSDVQFSGEDKGGGFWVANTEGLDEFDRRTGKVALHIPLREPSNGLSFYEDHFGVFWIYHVSGNALAVFDRKANTLKQFSFHQLGPPNTALTGVTAMLEDRNGALWLATHGAGLLKFDREHRRFIRYPIILLTLTASLRTLWGACSRIGKEASGLPWAEWGSPASLRSLCRLRDSLTIPASRPVGKNLSWVRYTRIVREFCGSVPPKPSTVSTARLATTPRTAAPPDQHPVPT